MCSKFLTVILILVLILAQFVGAEDRIFSSADIIPPNFPVEKRDIGKGIIIILTDIETDNCLRDVHVKLELKNIESGERINTIRYFKECNISLNIPTGKWLLTLKADNLSTEGKDFYSDTSVEYLNDSHIKIVNVYMKPVGSVRGEVIDNEGKIVVDARIKFECSAEYGVLDDIETDSYGSFRRDYLPEGRCRISALYNNKVGSVDVIIHKGKLTDVNIKLEKTTTTTGFMDYILYILVVFTVITFYAFFKKRKKGKKKEIKASHGMLSIMETLSNGQKRIVEELLKSGGKLSQVDICYKTGMPKASVSRYISTLESRKIIESTRIGRLKEVKLSEWFLSQ